MLGAESVRMKDQALRIVAVGPVRGVPEGTPVYELTR
jgi:hypothetical protein